MGSYFFKKYRGVVQLVERRSPKPDVAGSSPVSPANINFRIVKNNLRLLYNDFMDL